MRSQFMLAGAILPFLPIIDAMPATFQMPKPVNGTSKGGKSAIIPLGAHTASALYFQTNTPGKDNEIISLPILRNGAVGRPYRYKTGGKGCSLKVAGEGDKTLFSPGQNTVVVGRNNLFAVNSGSDSISMFEINPENPVEIRPVGGPVSSGGNKPVALAFCEQHKLLCVANAGASDGINCCRVNGWKGLHCPEKSLRKIRTPNGDKPTPQSTSPKKAKPTGEKEVTAKTSVPKVAVTKEPVGQISDMMFTHDGKNLIVISKSATASIIDVFPVTKGRVCQTRVRSIIKDAPKLFGTIQVCETEFFATDGSFGIAKLSFDPKTLKFTLKNQNIQKIDFQVITGPIAISVEQRSVYVGDLKINRVVEFDIKTGNRAGEESFNTAQPGNSDIVIGGDFLYTLSPENKLAAGDTSMIQTMFIQSKGELVNRGALVFNKKDEITQFANGLAVYNKQDLCQPKKLPFTRSKKPVAIPAPAAKKQKPVEKAAVKAEKTNEKESGDEKDEGEDEAKDEKPDDDAAQKAAAKKDDTNDQKKDAKKVVMEDDEGKKDEKKEGGKKDEGKKDEGKKSPGKKDEGEKDEGKKVAGKKAAPSKDEGESNEGKKDVGKKMSGKKSWGKKDEGEKSEGEGEGEGETNEDQPKKGGRRPWGKKPWGKKHQGKGHEGMVMEDDEAKAER
ncbi:hypothetical protein DRE_02100 [Drechslerella stenobrocha 248]|uniref:SMP-30/Gluconolactonase/LRE-like region domain-containing protein n=1 Tax=Drechslerella stenobrocha 248 TaxID=1043628 RepID=W7HVY7_9PEZI|nr:hypothetical protein DRE_02100 [Drechslerella stenobrocha 248]